MYEIVRALSGDCERDVMYIGGELREMDGSPLADRSALFVRDHGAPYGRHVFLLEPGTFSVARIVREDAGGL